MAKADIKMPEDFLMKLSRLGSNMDGIAETVLEAGGEVVLEKVRGNLTNTYTIRLQLYGLGNQ